MEFQATFPKFNREVVIEFILEEVKFFVGFLIFFLNEGNFLVFFFLNFIKGS